MIRQPSTADCRRDGATARRADPRIRLPALACLLIALLCAGCGATRPRPEGRLPDGVSFRTSVAAAQPQRIAVMPFSIASGAGRSASAIDEAVAGSLRELGLSETVAVPVALRDRLLPGDVLLANHIDAAALLRIRDQLNVDSVLIGRVEHFEGYDPVSIALTMHLVSCHDGDVLWSATGQLDGRRRDVQEDLEAWQLRSNGGGNESLDGWHQALHSPRLFCRYAAERLIGTMLPPREPEPVVTRRGKG